MKGQKEHNHLQFHTTSEWQHNKEHNGLRYLEVEIAYGGQNAYAFSHWKAKGRDKSLTCSLFVTVTPYIHIFILNICFSVYYFSYLLNCLDSNTF